MTLAQVGAVNFFPSGNAVGAGLSNGKVLIFDQRTNMALNTLSAAPESASITGLEFSKSGRALYTSHNNGSLGVWDPIGNRDRVHKLALCNEKYGETWPISGLTMAPDGTALAAGCFDGSVRVFTSPPPKKK